MRAIELFAGAGGAALGLEDAGVEHLALCEWDADACATLRAAGLGPVVEGDVRDLDAIAAVAGETCDLLWSSFPCQAFSTAGKRLGAEDERNGWPWTVAAIDRFKPAWFMGENVTGLAMHRGGCVYRGGQSGLFGSSPELTCPGCYFERVILPALRARFAHVGYWTLDAADYGVPQHRRRIILWAGPEPLAAPEPTHGPGRALPWVSMGEALGLSANEAAIGGGRNPGKPGAADRRYRELTHEPSTTVAAVQIGNAGPWVVAAGETGEGRPRPLTEAAPTVGTKGTAHLLSRPSRAVVCSEVKGSGPGGNPEKHQRASDALYLATGRRRLTVAECATLQAFPADHPWQGTKTAQYRQVGNAVPPTLARVVAESLMDVAGLSCCAPRTTG